MNTNKKYTFASGAIFLIAFVVYAMTAERTGSLWDCGEFILGAYKMQVVHPPGAPLFMIIGRVFAWLGDIFSADPSTIAFAVNLMSGLFTAIAAALVGHSTMLLSDIALKHDSEVAQAGTPVRDLVSMAAGVVAGLATAFSSSIWFSAVEGEVYAMSTFFTVLTMWGVIKWYSLPNEDRHDKWLVFSAFSAGLSIGVHLLSLLTFPALAVFVYFKKSKKRSWFGALGAVIAGCAPIILIQKLIITGIPTVWKAFDLFMVNSLGAPYNSGIILTIVLIAGIFFYLFRYAANHGRYWMQVATMAALMTTIGYSLIGAVVIRANADTPVNMNVPSDPTRLLPYLNREQYGERALLFGPNYEARPVEYDREERKGSMDFPPYHNKTDDKYVVVDEKLSPKFRAADKSLFPRISHSEMGRPQIYKQWYQYLFNSPNAKPSFAFNLAFFLKYQINWMYTRYFMWNFVGRQNAKQGYYAWDKSDGNWRSGIKFIDEMKLYNLDMEPMTMKNDKGNNNYYFLPLIFGLLGLFWHAFRSTKEFSALFLLFLVTGIGIILYTNQPPNEPRERDYVLVGSFFTFCMWMGLAVPALYSMVADKFSFKGLSAAGVIGALVLTAPVIMGFQNFDDHSRANQYGARDYAKNFLNSLEPNAIIFTYGDNDTYPLWYVQEVEDVRRDVRIVNLSLIAVDWYINKLRSKVNDSEPIKLTIPAEAYRGNKRNQLPFYGSNVKQPLPLQNVLKFIGENHPLPTQSFSFESFVPTRNMFIRTNYPVAQRLGMTNPADSLNIAREIQINFPESKQWITKDDLAVLDVIGSNIWDRPIYFATTCQNSKLLGLNDYMQYEGLALRIVPIKTPSQKQLSIYGSGRIDTDKVYDNIMNKFVWGNFDKAEVFVNDSYAAGLQAHRMVMNRAADELIKEGKADKAAALAKKYFEVFPHFNFPYDVNTVPFISVLVRTNQDEEAKKHMRILANEAKEHLLFYDSIDPDILASSFAQDQARYDNVAQNVVRLAAALDDPAFRKEMQDMLAPLLTKSVPN